MSQFSTNRLVRKAVNVVTPSLPIDSRLLKYLALWAFLSAILSLPLPILADSDDGAASACSEKPASGSASLFYVAGNKLCWNGRPLKLVGYGTTDLATRDGYDYSQFLNTIRFVNSSDPEERHGVNLTRIWATGTANTVDCRRTPKAHDLDQPSMTMPFQYLKGETCTDENPYPKYDMCISNVACQRSVGLNPAYTKRLQSILDEARRNGIVAVLVLFEGYFMGRVQDHAALYAKNPWNPRNNNLGSKRFRKSPGSNILTECNKLYRSKSTSDISDDAFPEFYEICGDFRSTERCDATLNCFGLVQKAYVESMVDLVKSNENGSDHVIFEILNRVRFDKYDPAFDLGKLKRWHDVIGFWVKCRSDGDCRSNQGDYLVSAVVGVADYDELVCSNPQSCPQNLFDVLGMPRIDILNLPARSWHNSEGAPGPCQTGRAAVRKFGKPVIIDTDGAPADRADKCQLKKWASEIATCEIGGRRNAGQLHFNHLDGMTFGKDVTKKCKFTGQGFPIGVDFDERYLDCHALDTIGDAGPTYLSGIVSTEVPENCPHSINAQRLPVWCSDPCTEE